MTNTVPTSQAARILNLSPRRVIQLHDEGRIRATWTPLGRLFDLEEVERFAAERALKGKPQSNVSSVDRKF